MNNLSIVIPSRNASNLSACVTAIWKHEPDVCTIVIDDGLDFQRLLLEGQGNRDKAAMILPGVRPFVFSRNVNLGIAAAGRDDVIILNDDAILETPRGFSRLQDQWCRHREYGLISPVIPGCGHASQRPLLDFTFHDREDLHAAVLAGHMPHPDGPDLRDEPRMLVFACVFLPRATIDRVGFLDEQFGVNADGVLDPDGPVGYGCEDVDYSWRVRRAGLKLGIYEPVRVSHGELPHTFRINMDAERYADDSIVHERLFESKWGRKPTP